MCREIQMRYIKCRQKLAEAGKSRQKPAEAGEDAAPTFYHALHRPGALIDRDRYGICRQAKFQRCSPRLRLKFCTDDCYYRQ